MSGGFEDLGLLPELVRATREQGWLLPSDVQDEAIPLLLGGGDVLVAAETGSGKTAAFALPAIQIVHETRRAAAVLAAASAAAGASAPARGGAGAGGGGSGESAKRARTETPIKLNENDRSPMLAVAPDGLVCQSRQERDWCGVRATAGVVAGKFYWEARPRDEGVCRFGWTTMAGSLDVGTDRNGWGFGATGKKSNGGSFIPYGEAFTVGDVVGCFLEMGPEGGILSFSKNGKDLGQAFALPKHAGPLYPSVCMRNAEVSVNFGSAPFAFPPRAADGFAPLESALPAQVVRVGDGAGKAGGGAGGKGGGKGGAGDATGPVCLILEPARDLAEQTHRAIGELKQFVAGPSIGHALLIGGVDGKETSRQLAAVPDIITATPSKLLDLVEGGKIPLSQVRLLILDEADRFTEEENLRMVNKLYARLRAAIDSDSGVPGRLQVCFFSATLHSPEVQKLADSMCSHPTWVDLKGKDSVPETVHHLIVPVDPSADRSWAAGTGSGRISGGGGGGAGSDPTLQFRTDGIHAGDSIAVRGGPAGASAAAAAPALSPEEASEGVKRLKQRMLVSLIDSLAMSQCIIFCRTNVDCNNLEEYLTAVGGGARFRGAMEKGKENPYSCAVLAGMRSMEERRRNLDAFREGDVRFLIATDVAARGLDIKELPFVVNMCLPDESENYIHRIGRVGRAERMGLAISLVATVPEKVWYHSNCKDRGRNCSNAKLKERGGCAIWYDEPALLRAVQRRLGVDPATGGAGIPRMPVAFNAPVPGTGAGAGTAAAEAAAGGAGAARGKPSSSSSSSGRILPYLFSLPPEFAGVEYGEEAGGSSGPASAHAELIRDAVSTLAKLELRAQDAYLALRSKFCR